MLPLVTYLTNVNVVWRGEGYSLPLLLSEGCLTNRFTSLALNVNREFNSEHWLSMAFTAKRQFLEQKASSILLEP
jgi:hypothetical protein